MGSAEAIVAEAAERRVAAERGHQEKRLSERAADGVGGREGAAQGDDPALREERDELSNIALGLGEPVLVAAILVTSHFDAIPAAFARVERLAVIDLDEAGGGLVVGVEVQPGHF